MSKKVRLSRVILGAGAAVMLACGGCSQEEASDVAKKAGASAEKAADAVAQGAGEVMEKGRKLASQLGEKATEYIAPLKEKFANLESLKESPEKLKAAVDDLIQSIEGKAEDIQLPEAMSKSLATIKEKLVALKDYLQGEVEQAKVDEHIQGIMDSVKSGLGTGDEQESGS